MEIRAGMATRANIRQTATGVMVRASTAAVCWELSAATGTTGARGRTCPRDSKNLARGKPLPPGIAKKLDGRLLGQLPHYDGYEWQQAGTDLILVALASGLIYEVLTGAFD